MTVKEEFLRIGEKAVAGQIEGLENFLFVYDDAPTVDFNISNAKAIWDNLFPSCEKIILPISPNEENPLRLLKKVKISWVTLKEDDRPVEYISFERNEKILIVKPGSASKEKLLRLLLHIWGEYFDSLRSDCDAM